MAIRRSARVEKRGVLALAAARASGSAAAEVWVRGWGELFEGCMWGDDERRHGDARLLIRVGEPACERSHGLGAVCESERKRLHWWAVGGVSHAVFREAVNAVHPSLLMLTGVKGRCSYKGPCTGR